MNKRNFITVALTVIIASSLIVAVTYANRQMNRGEGVKNNDKGNEMIGGQKDDHGCLIAAGYSWCEAEQKCFRPWEETCGVDPTEKDLDSIKNAFINKYNKSSDEIQVFVSQYDGDFARGGVKFSMNGEYGEGGIFLALKEKGVWKLAFDGNGLYSCPMMEEYGFPAEMIPDCYQNDTELQKKVGDYIRNNISRLSPEEAVLGGTFYVTEIRFEEGNTVKVEYEDGHIAFEAEAQYEILSDGSIRIEKFVIVEDYQD